MTKPDETWLTGVSQIDFPAQPTVVQDNIQVYIDAAWAYLIWATGLDLDTYTGPLEPLVLLALQAKTEQIIYAGGTDNIETAADFMMIQSFSAGSYSETRRSLTEIKMAGMIDVDPRVNALLWPLLTDDRRDDWMGWLNGTNAPAFEVTETAWGAYAGSSYLSYPLTDRVLESEPWSMYFAWLDNWTME